MKRSVLGLLGLFAATAVSFPAFASDSVVVRDPSAKERWQIAANPSTPLTWCWEDADEAKITCTLAGSKPCSFDVVRSGESLYGSFSLSFPAESEECLFDVVLELFKGGDKIKEETARIVCVRSATVRETGTASWRNIMSAKVFAYPAGGNTEMSVTAQSGTVRSRALDPAGGFDAIVPASDVVEPGLFGFSVKDGDTVVLEADLKYITRSTMIIVR